jgi:hypothetical protein
MNLQFSAVVLRSPLLDGAKDARGQQKEGSDEVKYAVHNDADQPERKQYEPDDRIENEREQRGGPADNEQDAEEKDAHLRYLLLSLVCTSYALRKFRMKKLHKNRYVRPTITALRSIHEQRSIDFAQEVPEAVVRF